jgi:hypothetical protein
VAWTDDQFVLVERAFGAPDFDQHGEEPSANTRRILTSGDRFMVGSTEIEFACKRQSWPVDLERERALLAGDDAAAWSVYTDELLAQADPLDARQDG